VAVRRRPLQAVDTAPEAVRLKPVLARAVDAVPCGVAISCNWNPCGRHLCATGSSLVITRAARTEITAEHAAGRQAAVIRSADAPAGSRTAPFRLPAARTPAVRTDGRAPACDRGAMAKQRKRTAFDLFVEALTHPVRFR